MNKWHQNVPESVLSRTFGGNAPVHKFRERRNLLLSEVIPRNEAPLRVSLHDRFTQRTEGPDQSTWGQAPIPEALRGSEQHAANGERVLERRRDFLLPVIRPLANPRWTHQHKV